MRSWTCAVLALGGLWLAGCAGDAGTPTKDGVCVGVCDTDEATDTGPVTDEPTDTGTTVPPLCGNGELDGDEGCDDGVNDGSYEGCLPDCSGPAAYCGDGEVNGPERCDDGVNDDSYDGCAPDCTPGPYCGDGEVNGPESCDDGLNDGSCGSCLSDCGGFGEGDFLTEVTVVSVPSTYGWPADFNPDVFFILYDGAGQEVYETLPVIDTQPPVRFVLPDILVDGQLWTVDVWDDDGGLFLDADDLGFVDIDTSVSQGMVSSGDLTVEWVTERRLCD